MFSDIVCSLLSCLFLFLFFTLFLLFAVSLVKGSLERLSSLTRSYGFGTLLGDDFRFYRVDILISSIH